MPSYRLLMPAIVTTTIALFTVSARAQGAPNDVRVIPGTRVQTPPKLDGVVDPAEWPDVARREGFFSQDTNQPAPARAEFWLTYDREYIYFAARVQADPGTIVKEEYRQNVSLEANDAIRIAIDPHGSLQSFHNFAFNPSGATNVQLAGGRANKTEWSGAFEAFARVTKDGWEGECRIPWSLLITDVRAKRDLRFNIGWTCMHTKREYLWQVHRGDLTKLGIWKDVELNVAPEPRALLLLPYAYAGASKDQFIANTGLDMKTNVTNAITAVGTINPDFRNIENQILSLDFSYLERLTGEARPFFLEGANFLNTGMDQRLFTSQRIRDVDLGVKTYGRLSPSTTFGVLSTWDFGIENATVLSIGQRLTPRSNLSAAYVGYQNPGKDNHGARIAYGNLIGTYDVYGLVMHTQDKERGSGTNYRTGYYRPSGNWETYGEYAHVSSDFFPRIGFAPERGFAGFYWGTEQKSYLKESPVFDYTEAEFFYLDYNRLDGSPYRQELYVDYGVALKNQMYVAVSHMQAQFHPFKDVFTSARIEFPREDRYRRFILSGSSGHIQGGAYNSLSANLLYRPIPYLQVSAGAQYVNHFGNESLFILSANYDIAKYESIGGRMSVRDGVINWYLSYRRSGGNGNEYFLILGDPNTESFKTQLILKAVMPIKIKY